MKVTVSPHMHSGMKNPEMEISTDVERTINKLLCRATEPSDDRSIDHTLPPNGYIVRYPTVNVHVANGTIAIRCFGTVSYLKDTVGLEKFLENLVGENCTTLREYYEDVFGISE